MAQNARILIIYDEATIGKLLTRLLQTEGYETFVASTGVEGLRLIEEQVPQLLILDINLPDITGDKICAQLRSEVATRHLPILMITGRDVEGTLARSLDEGADDYIAKPFNNSELMARVRALLRRPAEFTAPKSLVEQGPLRLDILTRQVRFRGRLLRSLSPKEFGILKYVVMQAPKVVSKESLSHLVWNTTASHMNPRTIDVHMRRIRMKLGAEAAACLKTVPRLGYQWVAASKSS